MTYQALSHNGLKLLLLLFLFHFMNRGQERSLIFLVPIFWQR